LVGGHEMRDIDVKSLKKRLEYEKRIEKAILERIGNGSSCSLTMKKDGTHLIVARNHDGTYHLYEGCELVVGDVSLSYISKLIATDNYHAF
jgi:hypothetical protein